MDIKEFKKESKSRPSLQFSNSSYGGLPWKDWYKLASMTNRINYGCSFFSDGTCIQVRKIKEGGGTPNKMCCCKNCARCVGFLDFIQDDPKVINSVAECFNPKAGFWRESKGCILPRKYRSITCLGYRCSYATKSFIRSDAKMLLAFFDSIRSESIEGRKLRNLGKALADINI